MNRLILFVLCALTLIACDTGSTGETIRLPGIVVENEPAYPALTAPDTVVAGRPFTLTAYTAGGGCYRPGDTEVIVRELDVEVRPYDLFYDPGPGGACTADWAAYPHTVTVTLAQPGSATVRVVGLDARSGAVRPAPTRVVVERRLVVTSGT